VTLAGLAATTIVPADRSGPPVYDPTTATCSQVYCHGDVLGSAGGATTKPRWIEDAPGPAPCSSCHGAPPPDHAPVASCAGCHPSPTTPTTPTHVNGAIELGQGLPGCSACHGSETSPAPPRDLDGNTLTTAIGVGAHQAHLQGLHRLATPVACAACHQVPATLTAPGHLDTTPPAEVLAALGWDRASQTCQSAACHGDARPVWTRTDEAYCGSCHGLPPASPPHDASMAIASCTTCHPSSVDAFGNIRFSGPAGAQTSTHLDGVVDAP
jgi:predicted CxxxxCH...CXXCH cytochrome family protein